MCIRCYFLTVPVLFPIPLPSNLLFFFCFFLVGGGGGVSHQQSLCYFWEILSFCEMVFPSLRESSLCGAHLGVHSDVRFGENRESIKRMTSNTTRVGPGDLASTAEAYYLQQRIASLGATYVSDIALSKNASHICHR